MVLEVSGGQVTGAVLSPVRVWVGSVGVFVEAPAESAMALRVVVVFVAVTVVLRMSDLPTVDLGEFVRPLAGLVLRPPLRVTEAGFGPPLFGRVDEPNRAVLLK